MNPRTGTVLLIVCLLVAVVVPAVAAGADQRAVIVESVTYGGDEIATTPDQTLRVWRTDSHEFSIQVRANESVSNAAICLRTDGDENVRELGCEDVELLPGDKTVPVTVDTWPADLTGEMTIRAAVGNETSNETLGTGTLSLTVLERDADLDGDGLANEAEVEHGTDMEDRDTDDDMLSDAVEVRTYDTSPTDPDSDSDGLSDGLEINRYHTDPTETDTDGDGLADGREIEIGTLPTRADTDGDGLQDGPEINRYQTNATDVDTDGDSLDDAAEVRDYETNPTESDTDGDGLTDGEEVSLYDTDPTRTDTDGDGLNDAGEVQTHYTDPTDADTDGDGLNDAVEIRDSGTDPLAADTDMDGVDDGAEAELGSDPTDPGDTAEPGLAYSVETTATERPLAAGFLAFLILTGIVLTGLHRYGWDISPGIFERAKAVKDEGDEEDKQDKQDGDDVDAESAGPNSREVDQDEPEPDPEPEGVTPTDPSILTNEERIMRLLDEHDGRMLQSDIVEAGDWSKATVSRVLSEMEEQGAVSRVDIGKGNLVARPGDEPANANSPFSK